MDVVEGVTPVEDLVARDGAVEALLVVEAAKTFSVTIEGVGQLIGVAVVEGVSQVGLEAEVFEESGFEGSLAVELVYFGIVLVERGTAGRVETPSIGTAIAGLVTIVELVATQNVVPNEITVGIVLINR